MRGRRGFRESYRKQRCLETGRGAGTRRRTPQQHSLSFYMDIEVRRFLLHGAPTWSSGNVATSSSVFFGKAMSSSPIGNVDQTSTAANVGVGGASRCRYQACACTAVRVIARRGPPPMLREAGPGRGACPAIDFIDSRVARFDVDSRQRVARARFDVAPRQRSVARDLRPPHDNQPRCRQPRSPQNA